ncbi:hypothetical protein [Archangium minus]|uniref:hypothetical protein n=1 Tax=Archangium minus TaxID=83450 RepID=UPI0037C08550
MAATEAPLADPLAAYPNPGRVTGDIGIHDPSMVKTPAGTYLAVSTGPNLQLKTSVDHYYTDRGAPTLGINLIGYDSQGWPFVY